MWLHVLLFALTLATTTLLGAFHYLGFLDDFRGALAMPTPFWPILVRGFWYSGTILAILGCHELGHYFACRYYDVDATLPSSFRLRRPFVTGTLGAVIRIREPFPSKRALFDIGIAGPIAGFVVTVPALFLGMALSHVARVPPSLRGSRARRTPAVQARLCDDLRQCAGWLFGQPASDGVCGLVRACWRLR